MSIEHIFVYGSLLRTAEGQLHPRLEGRCDLLGPGTMQGRLFEVAGYPGAIESADPAARVRGEIYRIRRGASVLQELDAYEECTPEFPRPHEYLRKRVAVSVDDGPQLACWVYLFNRDVSMLRWIRSGDYRNP